MIIINYFKKFIPYVLKQINTKVWFGLATFQFNLFLCGTFNLNRINIPIKDLLINNKTSKHDLKLK